jgi:P-type Mg2+ transporter
MSKWLGLNQAEVERIRSERTSNQIEFQDINQFTTLLAKFKSPIFILLLITILISVFLQEYLNALIILMLLIVNIFIEYFQDKRTKTLLDELNSYFKISVVVLRDGIEIKILNDDLVVGDIIKINSGNVLSADCVLLESNNLLIDESFITGESDPVSKASISDPHHQTSQNQLYAGSMVVDGEGVAQVQALGNQTKFGHLALTTLKVKKPSQFNKNMSELTKGFLLVGLIFITFIFVVYYLLGKATNFGETLIFVITIAISLIPQALPLVTNLALAGQSLILAKKGLIIKNRQALEDLGNMDVLCTDKTGTLTENRFEVLDVIFEDQDFLPFAAKLAYQSNDPHDLAVENYLMEHKLNFLANKSELLEEIIFKSENQFSGRVFKDYTLLKGSPEKILEKIEGKIDKYLYLLENCNEARKKGIRPILYAIKRNLQDKYELIGGFLFAEKIKSDAIEIIKQAKNYNLKLKILTGDNYYAGLYFAGNVKIIKSEKEVIDCALINFDNKHEIEFTVKNYTVFTNTKPEQKLKIIQALEQKYVVGYLGDGVNDVPALKIANIGLVVDSASDVARSTADIIVAKKDLKPIIDAVLSGRKVYENINKYIKQSLSGSFGNFFTIGLLSLLVNFTPILPVQILLVNLLSDFPLLAIANDNVDENQLRKPKHQSLSRLLFLCLILGLIASVFDIVFLSLNLNSPTGQIQTSWFFFSIITESLLLFSIRTKNWFFSGSLPPILLLLIQLFVIIIAVGLSLNIFAFFNISTISTNQILSLTALALLYFTVTELTKVYFYKKFKRHADEF